jgi:hypothetical protein
MKNDLINELAENRGRRNKTKMNNRASAVPSQRFAESASRLAVMMPRINDMEIQINGMDMLGIVH